MTGAAWLVAWLALLLALFVIAATIIPHEETKHDHEPHRPTRPVVRRR